MIKILKHLKKNQKDIHTDTFYVFI